MTDKNYMIAAEEMERTGGSFVKALAGAFFRADAINTEKLLNAFPEYFEEYYNRGKENPETMNRVEPF